MAETPTEPGGRDDLIAIYRDAVGPLYAWVSRRCGGRRELAEDVTQETFLRAVRQWRSGPVPGDPGAWLRTVARNLLVSHFRRRRPEPVDPAVVAGMLESAETPTPEAAALIHWGLGRLGEQPGRLIEAFHLDGRSLRHIAAETGLSERAVEGRLHRARRALRKELQPVLNGRGGDA